MNLDLFKYNFPDDLKKMNLTELDLLSYSIRDFLIESLSMTGGHVASNLGVVELTIGIHKVFDSPIDKIIWDVGHQAYVHKILTGRAAEFNKLRQFKGISGFPKKSESIHDIYETGHASTSLSAAAGIAAARDIKGQKGEVIAVIGDGALTGGLAFEALNNIGVSKSKVIVILNDNGMSISKNVGGLSQHLGELRVSHGYLNTKKKIKKIFSNIPVVGEKITNSISHTKERIKYAVISGGVIFEELGFTYIGLIDGHSIKDVIEALEMAKNAEGPVLIHMITQKGKGYKNAEKMPNKFHGIGPFDSTTGLPLKKEVGTSYSNVMGQAIVDLATKDEKIVAITAAMGIATGLGGFAEKFPKRYFDVGIAEEHAVNFAAGLATAGMKPVVAIYSTFLQRAFDQIAVDVCLQNLPVLFQVDRAGIVGADGETHHGIYDISYLSLLPNITILTPRNGSQLVAMTNYGIELDTPCAIRYPRGNTIYDKNKNIPHIYTGKNERLAKGKEVDIWAVGTACEKALLAKKILETKGYSVGIVDVTIVKPMDLDEINEDVNLIVTIEDNALSGGFGQQLSSRVNNRIPIINFAWPDKFIEHGSIEQLEKEYKLDGESIAERIGEYFERKA